jgi:hypothetical protein
VRGEGDRNEVVSVECALIRVIVIYGEVTSGLASVTDSTLTSER